MPHNFDVRNFTDERREQLAWAIHESRDFKLPALRAWNYEPCRQHRYGWDKEVQNESGLWVFQKQFTPKPDCRKCGIIFREHQRIGIAPNHRQGRIEFLENGRSLSAGFDHGSGAPHRFVKVARAEFERCPARQRLHLVDQLGDPVDLVRNQRSQGEILAIQLAPQQLRSAADSGQGILDLVRKDFRRPQDPALPCNRCIAQSFCAANVDEG